jgi:DNA-binding IclR family transcriptional regulator
LLCGFQIECFETESATVDKKEILQIKQRGYALDRKEYNLGIWSVAAPVYDHTGSVVASLAIAAPSVCANGRKPESLISMILDSSAKISREIGYEAPAN